MANRRHVVGAGLGSKFVSVLGQTDSEYLLSLNGWGAVPWPRTQTRTPSSRESIGSRAAVGQHLECSRNTRGNYPRSSRTVAGTQPDSSRKLAAQQTNVRLCAGPRDDSDYRRSATGIRPGFVPATARITSGYDSAAARITSGYASASFRLHVGSCTTAVRLFERLAGMAFAFASRLASASEPRHLARTAHRSGDQHSR